MFLLVVSELQEGGGHCVDVGLDVGLDVGVNVGVDVGGDVGGVVGVCLVAKLPPCSGSAIIETGGELETSHSESEGEVEVGTQWQLTGNWNTLGTLNTQGTHREPLENTQGTLREQKGTLRKHPGNSQGTSP